MAWVKGSSLSQEMQRQALARFVHRFTGEHRPAWAAGPRNKDTLCTRTLALYKPGVVMTGVGHHFSYAGEVPGTGVLRCTLCGELATEYTPQHATDSEWLACTEFAIKSDGSFDSRYRWCRTYGSLEA